MKERLIEEAIAERDLWKLRELALLDVGLLNDSLRRRAYKLLLAEDITWNPSSLTEKDRQAVRWDVMRLHELSDPQREMLVYVIERSCRYYYQGFHQIAKTILRIFQNDTDETINVLRRLYVLHVGQFVSVDELPIVRLVQLMGPPMLCLFDFDLYQVIDEYAFSIGWILTWFASFEQPRLLDAMMASHTLFPLYLSFAHVIQHKQMILEEPMNVHRPLPVLNADDMVRLALDLMARLPPNQRLWLVASHYYGDGAVEDLLSTAASNSLLRLATPESSEKPKLDSSPRACIAAGIGRPKQPQYKRFFAWCVAAVASIYWAWQRFTRILPSKQGSETLIPPPPLITESTEG